MIYIFWRGAGIIVPILLIGSLLLVAWIGGYNRPFGDAHAVWCVLGNGIFFTLYGSVDFINNVDEETGKRSWKFNNTFFFLPILVWGLLFLIGSLMSLLG